MTALWHDVEGASCLVRRYGNPENLADRVAFIEKSPRVRIRHMDKRDSRYGGMDRTLSPEQTDWLNWTSGNKGSGPDDPQSRKWCEDMLTLMEVDFQRTDDEANNR